MNAKEYTLNLAMPLPGGLEIGRLNENYMIHAVDNDIGNQGIKFTLNNNEFFEIITEPEGDNGKKYQGTLKTLKTVEFTEDQSFMITATVSNMMTNNIFL